MVKKFPRTEKRPSTRIPSQNIYSVGVVNHYPMNFLHSSLQCSQDRIKLAPTQYVTIHFHIVSPGPTEYRVQWVLFPTYFWQGRNHWIFLGKTKPAMGYIVLTYPKI